MNQTSVTISSAAELHQYLQSKRQFDFNPDHTRDAPLYAALKRTLQLPEGEFLIALRARNATAEAYLRALIEAAEPLAAMYRQILDYCARANFLSSNNGAAIEFQLSSGGKTVGFSYEDFRRFDEIKASLTPSMDDMRNTKNDVMNWLAHDVFPPSHQGLSQKDLDWDAVEIFAILKKARDKYGADYASLFGGLNNHYLKGTGQPAPPHLKSRVVNHQAYQSKRSAVARHFPLDAIELVASKFIELPFWKFRWQVYEIWVVVVSMSEFEPLGFQLTRNRDGQSLIEQGRMATLATHVDGRHTLIYQPTYQNRDDAEIRPDMVISRSDAATPDDVQLIVECKQRVNLDVPHIDDVAQKYTAGTAASVGQVVIVNYDEAPSWSDAGSGQATLIDNMRPDTDGEQRFRQMLRASATAKALRNEVWFIDISYSMREWLDDEFRQFLSTRAAACAQGAFRLYGFAETVAEIAPTDARGSVPMSDVPGDANWEGVVMKDLGAKLGDYLDDSGRQIFVVSDLDDGIAATLLKRDDIGGARLKWLKWINPSNTCLRDLIEANRLTSPSDTATV